MRIILLALLVLFLTHNFVAYGQDELTVEEAEIELLIDEVQNDIDELDGTHAKKIKELNEETKRNNDQIKKENELIKNMQKEAKALEQQMKALEAGGDPNDNPDSGTL